MKKPELAADIIRISTGKNLRADLIERGFRNVERYKPEVMISKYVSLYEQVLSNRWGSSEALTIVLPWPLRRWVLSTVFGYRLDRTSHIGFAWIFPRELVMQPHSRIGHFTVCKGLELLHMGSHASIGRANWITGYPSGSSQHFVHQPERLPCLIMGDQTSITHRHLIDCTNSVSIGSFTTVAGFRSQILTHSIDLENNRQSSAPITIGDYCFIGTDCVLLGGSSLPDRSVLGAKSLLNKQYECKSWLYAGTPARPVKELERELAYFARSVGRVQ